MGRINFGNIQNQLNKIKDATAPLQNMPHTENVPVDFIYPSDMNVFNENDTEEDIKELADSIRACGLNHPISVNKFAPEKYRIISGERRYKAITKYLQWRSIPCMVFDNLTHEQEQLKLYTANLAVREYTASQKYRFYLEVKELLEKMKQSGEYKGGMQKGIAEILNVTERQVKKYYQLDKLSENVQNDVLEGKISINKALEIPQKEKKSEPDPTEAALNVLLGQLSAEQREMLISGKVDLVQILSNNSISQKGAVKKR